MLHPRAPDHEIFATAIHDVGKVRAHVDAYGRRIGAPMTPEALSASLDELARVCQARPVASDITLNGRIARMLDSRWWYRNIRRGLLRESEAIEHAQGRIRRKTGCYASDYAVAMMAARNKASREVLVNLEVVNETGEAVNLLEAVDASVSNPRLRRAELMTRCRGFEELATFEGHQAVFLTITCPSRFHRYSGQGKANPQWNGSTPSDGQKYLCAVWARIRASWKRQGFFPYGFRVAEPHHDGCPHWHILLFAPADQMGSFDAKRAAEGCEDSGTGLVGIAGSHAMRESPNERGAVEHRFTCEPIDPSKGSATGYIAKYISKNIDGLKEDGSEVGLDFASGTEAATSSARVRAWASIWRIRQFQQIGGPSVTVWREARRLDEDTQAASDPQRELIEHSRSAADRGLWSVFWLLQGGPGSLRQNHPLKPLYEESCAGQYGDTRQRIKGVICTAPEGSYVAISRPHEWRVQRSGQATVDACQFAWREHLVFRRNNTEFISLFERFEFERSSEAASTWTRVNNCTATSTREQNPSKTARASRQTCGVKTL